MEVTLALIQQILAMVLIALAGFVLCRARFLDREKSKSLSVVALYLASPCAMISAFQTQFDAKKSEALLVTLFASVLIHGLYMLVTHILSIGRHGLTDGEHVSALFNNSSNLIIPLVVGTLGPKYVLFTTSFVLVQNLLCWTYGVMILKGGERKIEWRNALITPTVVGMLMGLILFLLQIKLPSPVSTALSSVGACLGPLSMLVIGVMLAEADLKKALSSRSLHWTVSLRLVFLPILSAILLWLIGRVWGHTDAHNILMVTLLCSIGPCSATITQLSQLYNHVESGYISTINAVSTLLSAVSIPVIIIFYEMLVNVT